MISSVLGKLRLGFAQLAGVDPPGSDVTAPITVITTLSRTKISRVAGQDIVQIDFATNEPFVEYQIRRVDDGSLSHFYGDLIEQASVSSRTTHTVDVTDDELVAANGAEGANIVKVFAKDAAGNWSA